MFTKMVGSVATDLSFDLHDEFDWKVGCLRTLDFPLNVSTLAIDPVASLLAAGTVEGNIHIFGRPSVHYRLSTPQNAEVRFLQFSIPTLRLLCIDGTNQLHVYSLLEFGKPKLLHSSRFDQINSLILSPSHTHVFVVTQKGVIKTYDVTCLRKSPYVIPNLWVLYEERASVDGIPSLTPSASLNVIDTVIHPRNLDLMFVAYEGGIILTDLTERSIIRAYELVLSPGAPGGSGYNADDILTHRRMMVTSLAVHPSGHMLSVGYTDGSIAFWAVEDDTKPLVVRTLDRVDVNLVDANLLDKHISSPDKASPLDNIREPIFKLSWSGFSNSSDPRGGETVLTVLGGVEPGEPPGFTTLVFPPFNPPEPLSELGSQNGLHPFFRDAMCESVIPDKLFYCKTRGVVQDYLLIPRNSPHFAGTYDPYSILLISEINGTRTTEAFEFPPSGGVQVPLKVEEYIESAIDKEAASAPSSMLNPPLPKSSTYLKVSLAPVRTPVPLSSGHSGILGGHHFKINNDIHKDLTEKVPTDVDFSLNLKGGNALADPSKSNELKLSKYQPHRLLMTFNQDLSVRFFDISTQLLIPSNVSDSLEHDWPQPLPGLTVLLRELFDDSIVVDSLSTSIENIEIQSAQVAPEGLECAIALTSGDIVVYHPATSRAAPIASNATRDSQITLLTHIQPISGYRLAPYFIFAPTRGRVEAFSLADIGFLAVSYGDGSLFIIDLRGPKVIFLRDANKKSKRASVMPHGPHLHHEPDVIKSLTWTISPLEKDPQLSVRLVALRQSGNGDIYSLKYSGNPILWSVAEESTVCKGIPDPIAGATFVFDSKTGVPWKADRVRLAASFKGTIPSGLTGNTSKCIILTIGTKGARCAWNLNGEKLGKVEWGSKHGIVQSAQIVEHANSRALVVQTDRHDALIYSIPHLEYMHTLQIPVTTSLPLSIDETGDFIAWTVSPQHTSTGLIHSVIYGTFFDVRRAYTLPDIDFTAGRSRIPPQPQPVSLGPPTVLGSWFSFNQTKTGDQIDAFLGGPDRPITLPEKSYSSPSSGVDVAEGITSTAAGFAASATALQANIYSKMTNAMSERGQLLGDLEERFNSLGEGSKNMVAQAKKLAAQQTAKTWFGF